MSFTPSKLFHAVVITGAALTGCAATSGKSQTPADAKTAQPADAATQAGGTCPPGSERPFPPCFWIK